MSLRNAACVVPICVAAAVLAAAVARESDGAGPDRTEAELAGAETHTVRRGGARTARFHYIDGGFYIYDASRKDHWLERGEPALAAIEAAFRSGAVAAVERGVVFVAACCEGNEEVPLHIAVHSRAPRLAAGYRAHTDVDLPAPSGELWIEGNGGSGVGAVIHLDGEMYRARVSSMRARELQQRRERFRLDLWPSS